MNVTKTPVFFRRAVEGTHVTTGAPVGKPRDPEALPVGVKLRNLRTDRPCLATAACHGLPKSTATVSEQFANGVDHFGYTIPVEGFPFVSGAGSASDALIGAANVYDKYKKGKRAAEMKDGVGQVEAVAGGVESGLLVVGSGSGLSLKCITALQDIGQVAHHPVALSGSVVAAQGVLGLLSKFALGLYYVFNGIRYGFGLISWLQGRAWRQKLLESGEDPMEALYKELNERIDQADRSKEQDIQLALKYGARWLGKIEAASEGRLKIKDKKEAFRQLVLENPGLIRELIGDFDSPLTAEGELIRFGIYMAEQNICAKFEAECARKLGEGVVEALQVEDSDAVKEALRFKEWIGLALKIGAAALGLVTIIILAIVLTHSPIGVLLILAALASIAMIFVTDFKALKEHFQNGEFKKRDRIFFYVTLALSVVSFVTLVGLTIATGGLPLYAVALTISAVWLGIQGYSAYALWRFDHRRWKVQKEVDLKTYRKFLESKPDKTDIAEVWKRLDTHVKQLKDMTVEQLKAEEARIAKLHKEQLDRLIAALKQSSR